MKVKIESGKISFDVVELLNTLMGEERKHLIELLACENDVIDAVCDQIIEGYTQQQSLCGSYTFIFPPVPSYAIDRAKRRITESRDEIAASELKKAADAVKASEERVNAAQTQRWEMEDKYLTAKRTLTEVYRYLHKSKDSMNPDHVHLRYVITRDHPNITAE